MNDSRTSASICAVSDPSLVRRLRRETKALAIVKAIVSSPAMDAIEAKAVIVDPPKPEPTYTFWRHPNDTFPTGPVVYFMYAAGRIKVGFSSGLRGRQMQLRAAGPFPPVVVLIIKGTEEAEIDLHAKFSAERLHGEWFRLSGKLRSFLNYRLCPVGRVSLQKAEAEFRDYCEAFLTDYRKPTKRPSKSRQCPHGKPMHQPCYPCELERDLKILENLK